MTNKSDIATIKDKIINYIKERDYVSFAELSRHVVGFHCDKDKNSPGSRELSVGTNILIWTNMTVEGAEAISELLNEKTISMEPTQLLTYMIDGSSLNLPIVKRAISYKKPHWLPVVLRLSKKD